MNKKVKIKIGLDYHGVINMHPKYFSAFAKEALARGDEIHVITGGSEQEVASNLKNWNIPYSKIFSIPDYYKAKAEYCNLEGINMHVDDSQEYIKWFTTPYCRYDGKNPQCITEDGHVIDFSAPPAEVLDCIEKFIAAN